MSPFSELLQGYHQFRQTGWQQQRERWQTLKEGQSPKIMIIACSDSRVDPAQIFNTRPGEVFVVRNVAALVPPFETQGSYHGVSAALEFAVQVLKVEEVLVMGHGMCGGCNAALTQELADADPGEGGFIANWIKMLDPARAEVIKQYPDIHDREALRAMEKAAVKVSLDNLRTFPCVRKKEREGELRLIGAYFAISDGLLHVLNHETGSFEPQQ
jgi:carbonic anhydrase